MRSSLLTVSALLLTTATLAACGGGVDKADYVQSVTNLQQRTSTAASERSADMAKATTPATISQELSELGAAIEKNATELGKIEAPDEVTELHNDYVKLMTDYGKDLESLAGEVKSSDAKTTNRLLKRASTITSDLATKESKLVIEINTALR